MMDHSATIRIRIDHRERPAEVAGILREMPQVEAVFEELETGDYVVDDALVFERKTLIDFAASVIDARLFRQASRLASLAPPLRGVIILEGTARELAASEMSREALQGALITLSIGYGLPILRSMDGEETARLMLYAARQARMFASGAYPRKGKRPTGKRKAQLALLQELPGVGPDRAARLIEQFGSVEAVLLAEIKQLRQVQGIGQRTAEAIRWLVSEEPVEYQPKNHGK